MSSTTIVDPSGSSPIPAYNNDKNLVQDVLLNVESTNLAESDGIFKINWVFDTNGWPDTVNTQSLSGGGTDTTNASLNVCRFQLPFDAKLLEISATVSRVTTIDGANTLNLFAQESAYTTAATIPETQWSDIAGVTLTMNSTTAANLFKSQTANSYAMSKDDSFRIKLTRSGSPNATIQIQALFKAGHV